MDGREESIRHRIRVQFSKLGSNRDYLDLDRLMGVKSKHHAREGIEIEGRPAARQNVWTFWGDETEENSDFDAQWVAIDRLIDENKHQIVGNGKSTKLQVEIVVGASGEFPAFNLDREVLRDVGSIGASVDVDLYGFLTGEVF